jgi:hypothetical protein
MAAGQISRTGALANRLRERTIDDIGCVELLLDQSRPKIQVDRRLLVGDDAIIDRRDPDSRGLAR